jgi:hypothetical protein
MTDGRFAWSVLLGALLACSSTACSDDAVGPAPFTIADGCNPIASEHDCLLPYPSDAFLVDDDALPTGKRVVIEEAALPTSDDGVAFDPFELYAADGFSPSNQILVLFPQDIESAPLVGAVDDFAQSLGDGSPTVLLEAETGVRVPHFAELDPRATSDSRRALVIRPVTRLKDATRYVVAIRRLLSKDGTPLAPPAAFAALRDDGDTSPPPLAVLAKRYDADVFAPLEEAGVERRTLQLAWDFTTRSRDNLLSDMLAVREQTMAYFEAATPKVTVVSVEDQPEPYQARRIEATVEVPLFLEHAEPMAALNRSDNGEVVAKGTTEVPFTIIVPESVANRAPGSPPARLMQFGHGFFGGREETNGFIDQLADERGFVVVATDWWGMSDEDRLAITDTLITAPSSALGFTDRVHQAMANYMAVAYAASGQAGPAALLNLPELQIGEAPLYDAANIYFYGLSQGGILGGSYVALSPLVERAVFGVGGGGFSFLMFRARPWVVFIGLMQINFPDALDQQKMVMLMQSGLDRIDPLSFAPALLSETFEGGPRARKLLMQIGMGDTAVPNLAAHLHARSLGIPSLDPAPRTIPLIASANAPLDAALVEFDFGIDPLPGAEALPPSSDNEVHDGVRQLGAAKEQLGRFFRPGGVIEQTCDGACDPE